MSEHKPRIIVALDVATRLQALQLADTLDPSLCRIKIGKEMFTRFGPDIVRDIHARGYQVFLDLKFHDIPNTVAAAVKAAADLGVWMVNVHASGGPRMMQAAAAALREFGPSRPHLIAVTVLTSFDQQQLNDIGVLTPLSEQVRQLARLTKSCGLDGVVCSAMEAADLRADNGGDFVLVTPGIRPQGSGADDQVRTMAPAEAVQAGSHYLVVGRPITQAANPRVTLCEMAEGL